MHRFEYFHKTGETALVEMTDKEIAENRKFGEEYEERRLSMIAEKERLAKLKIATLSKLGLSEDEVKAILS